ncbi:MAG: TonB-dependent receptor [Bacteroidota bacterium]|nr:TonB-dependent receptor [Bacteroidota bacterium]
MKNTLIILIFMLSFGSQAQHKIKGIVYGNTDDNRNIPLSGVSIYWDQTQEGTQSDNNGRFEINFKENGLLVFSHIGMRTEMLMPVNNEPLSVVLYPDNMIETIVVQRKRESLSRLKTNAANVTHISSSELLKAACCNLSESFETNPSIDVNFSDAVTGNKQIRMLGLNSPYILVAEENIPAMRGASQAYGLSFIPGTWVESIQITKGAGSVINGYESISGQINYELIKPATDIPLFVNAYASADARFELNTHLNKKLSDKWATSLFLHGNARTNKNDMNHDHFLDNPIGKQINVMNRWQYTNSENGILGFLNLRYMHDDKRSGSIHFDPQKDKYTTNHWGSEIQTQKVDIASKIGYVFPDTPWKSIGFQNAFNHNKQDSYFGLRDYNIQHNSYYTNLIYNSIISNTLHKFAAGINFTYDNYKEVVGNLDNSILNDWSRNDNSIGAFTEYTYDNQSNFSAVLGIRIDNHNRLGSFLTPRVYLRYNPYKKTTLKASIGKGTRNANIFAENQHLFGSSRHFNILNAGGKIYGLNPEVAWNYGANIMQSFDLFGKKAEIIIDFYQTYFKNQVVVDLYNSPQEVVFYNLENDSYANSFQLEFNLDISHHFNIRTAYKYYDVQARYITGKDVKPLQAQHRFFTNIGYETHVKDDGKQWKFDWTMNIIGKQKIPYTGSNPTQYQTNTYSPNLTLMNAQITRTFSKVFEVYLGAENLTNYKQQNAIIADNDPFGAYFDSSMIYAPVFGRMFYAGLRFKIDSEK